MDKELTPWFHGEVNPLREGVYERQASGEGRTAFWHWNGKFWEYGGEQKLARVRRDDRHSYDQSLPWRGLASDPKASKP